MRVSGVDVVGDWVGLTMSVQFSNILLNFHGGDNGSFFDINRHNEVNMVPFGVETGIEVSDRDASLKFAAEGLGVVLELIPVES